LGGPDNLTDRSGSLVWAIELPDTARYLSFAVQGKQLASRLWCKLIGLPAFKMKENEFLIDGATCCFLDKHRKRSVCHEW
jgi:hypothetical protein